MFRVGIGYDIHAAVEGNSIFLGGEKIPANFSLKGHSDADVLLHALTDAILGALGLKDIGYHFSNQIKENKNKRSKYFLQYADKLMRLKGYSIINIDMNLICEQPKLTSYREKIEKNISKILKIEIEQINLKAKTNEKLDALGKGKGIAAQVIILLTRKASN